MRRPHIDDTVRLVSDVPELSLLRGELGVVRSEWFAPAVAYEVEFQQLASGFRTRVLLMENQVAIEETTLAPAT